MKRSAVLVLGAMAACHGQWQNPVSGLLGDPTSWVGGVVPDLNPTINSVGDPFTVLVDKLTFLTSPLNLGGLGSYPTLLLSGNTLNVPGLNFASGLLRLENGAVLNVTGSITVNSTGSVTIEADATSSIIGGPIHVHTGSLVMNGAIPIKNKMDVNANANVVLNGTHAAIDCDISGDGALQIVGDLNLNAAASCNIDVDVDMMGGNILSDATDAISRTLSLKSMNVLSSLPSTIAGVDVRVLSASIASGSLAISPNAKMTILGDLVAPIQNSALISGSLSVLGKIDLSKGALTLAQGTVSANVNTKSTSTLNLEQIDFVTGTIQNLGTIVTKSVNVTGSVNVMGGSLQNLQDMIVNRLGNFNLKSTSVSGSGKLSILGTLGLNNVVYAQPVFYNGGYIMVNQGLTLLGKSILEGAEGSVFQNLGEISADTSLDFLGTVGISGNFTASASGIFNMKGIHDLLAPAFFNGPVTAVNANVTVGPSNRLRVNGDMTLTSSLLNLPKIPMNKMNILNADLTVDGNLILNGLTSFMANKASVSVSGAISLQNSLFQADNAKISIGSISLDDLSRLEVSVGANLDVMNVMSNAKLAGVLELNIVSPLSAIPLSGLPVLSYGAKTGTFANVQVNVLDGVVGLLSNYGMDYAPTQALFKAKSAQVSDETATPSATLVGEEDSGASTTAIVFSVFALLLALFFKM